jgi:hypothetical protein
MEIRRSCRNDSNWMDREDAAPFQEGLLPHPSAKSAYEWGTLNMESRFLGLLVGL